MKITLLIDGKYFIYKSLNTKTVLTYNEMRTDMIYFLLSSIKSITKKFKPDKTIIMWDSQSKDLRRAIYPGYKNKIKTKDPKIIKQIQTIQEEYPNVRYLFKKIGFASYLLHSYEADDLFAFYKQQYPSEKIIIASKDEDLYQLLEKDRIVIYDPKNKIIKDEKWFTRNYNITPKQWIMYKGINGCESDDVPGIPGVGPKTTLKYLTGFANEKERKKIISNSDTIKRNYLLVTLPFDRPTFPLRETNTKLNMDAFISLCQIYGFKSFLENLNEWEIFQ